MTFIKGVYFFLLIAAFSLLSACSPYSKLLRSTDISLKYKAAETYYDKSDYQRALPLLEDVYKFYIGTVQAEKISYMLAYAYYKMGEYPLGAYQFKNFSEAYPLSQYAEEASYYYAYCLFLDSPQKDLDQSSTKNAIVAFQLYVDKFPKSKHIEECNKNIDILANKLEQKALDNAVLYYTISNYKAAVWAVRNFLTDYPQNKERERLEYIIVKSAYLYAQNSIEEKQKERYIAMNQYYTEFKEKYPKSIYDSELSVIIKSANSHIQELSNKKAE